MAQKSDLSIHPRLSGWRNFSGSMLEQRSLQAVLNGLGQRGNAKDRTTNVNLERLRIVDNPDFSRQALPTLCAILDTCVEPMNEPLGKLVYSGLGRKNIQVLISMWRRSVAAAAGVRQCWSRCRGAGVYSVESGGELTTESGAFQRAKRMLFEC